MKRIICTALATALWGIGPIASAQDAPNLESSARGQAVEGVAVLVNDEVISYTDVRNRIRLILLSLGSQPTEEAVAEAERQAIESLIEEKIQLQEFAELTEGDTIDEAEINQQLAGIAQRNGTTLEQFINNLRASGVNEETIRDQVRADISWTALIRGRFGKQVRVSELRVDSMLERFKSSLNEPQYRVAEIFLYAPDADSKQVAMTRANTLKRQIEQGAPFEQVAQQFSAAPSASAGGDLSWLAAGDLRPEILAAVSTATPPVLLPPIESESGVYLVALLGKREPSNDQQVTLDMRQIVSQGADAVANLTRIKSEANSCRDLGTLTGEMEGVNVVEMGVLQPEQLSDPFKSAVENLDSNQSTDILDVGDNKMLLYVCERSTGGANMPTRDDIRDRLFDTEITMLAERYLRDLKREATIDRR